ncbi:MAG: hypothetical protein ACLQVJ_02785 [Syntrophobacteraceae bacterium]
MKLDTQLEMIRGAMERERYGNHEGIPLTAPSLVIDRSGRASKIAAGCLPRYAKFIAKGCSREHFAK